jgi:hypothetical protein
MACLKMFEAGMLLLAMGIPFLVARLHWCPGDPRLLSHSELFASFVRNGVTTPHQVCLFEDILILFLIYTIAGCWLLANSYRQRARNLQKALNKHFDEKKTKMLFASIFVFITFAILLIGFIPDSAKLGRLEGVMHSEA